MSDGADILRESRQGERVSTWTADELRQIVEADDLHVAPLRAGGETHGTPTWIWCVAADGGLYVRAYSGAGSSWYRAAVREGAGRIVAAGGTLEVAFVPVPPEDARSDRIDDAYREKYAGSPYLGAMISERARRATVRIVPRTSA